MQPALGAAYLSMAEFAQARGVFLKERVAVQLRGEVHPLDEEFVAAVGALRERFVLLENFPRTVMEVRTMLQACARHGWRFEVLTLTLPGNCVESSTQRQLLRGPRAGREFSEAHLRERALKYLAYSAPAHEVLRAHGVPMHFVDGAQPPGAVKTAIRRALGFDFEQLTWPERAFEALRVASEQTNIDAWLSCGAVYRPFFNDRFGPAQRPTDFDVAVNEEWQVEPLAAALDALEPFERWSVLCPSSRLIDRFGLETESAEEAKRYTLFLHRAGLARRVEGRLDVLLPEGCEAALRNGVVRLNPVLLNALSPTQRAETISRHSFRVENVLGDYPGLTVEPPLVLPPPAVSSRHVTASFRALKAKVKPNPPLKQPLNRRRLTPPELEVAHEILEFHRVADTSPQAPPLPPKRAWRRGAGLRELAATASDATFGAWFLSQLHGRNLRPDADVKRVLELTAIESNLNAATREQSPLHQGWPLDRHLAQSVLQLHTDSLVRKLQPVHGARWCEEVRLSMRLAMLFHDTGKLLGQRPRRHGDISERLFQRFAPAWLSAKLVRFTSWLIRTHDVYGRFARGVTDKQGHAPGDYAVHPADPTSYAHALDSQALRAVLREPGLPLPEAAAISKEVWKADVGSVASLRWLLPVADLVERLLLIPLPPRVARG